MILLPLLLMIVIVIAFLSVNLTYIILKCLNLVSLNYRGKTVVKSLGISLVLFSVIILLIRIVFKNAFTFFGQTSSSINQALVYLTAAAIFLGLIGFIDDLFGSAEYKGLKGHFKALSKGKVTTGFIKAITGVAAGFIVSWAMGGSIFIIIVRTLTFSLCVNFFNLLDLRPGRAIKVYIFINIIFIVIFWSKSFMFFKKFMNSSSYLELGVFFTVLLTVLYSFVKSNTILMIIYIVPALMLLHFDLKELAFLGDSGSNVLGAIIGFFIIAYFSIIPLLVTLIILIVIQVIAEISSFTRIIEKNSTLKWFDNLGRLN